MSEQITIIQKHWHESKSTSMIFHDTHNGGVHARIIGVTFWKWIHPGMFVGDLTVPGGVGPVPRVHTDQH